MKSRAFGQAALLAASLIIPSVVVLGNSSDPAEADPKSTKLDAKTAPQGRSGKVTIERGHVRFNTDFEKRNHPRVAKARNADGAAQGFLDALSWALASEASDVDPEMVPEALGGALNTLDAEMIVGFDREEPVTFDPSAGTYRILGYSGPQDNPDQVMVEVSVALETDGETRMLVAGGVMVRSPEGWVPTSMRPRDLESTPEAIDGGLEIVEKIASGEYGIGWRHMDGASE